MLFALLKYELLLNASRVVTVAVSEDPAQRAFYDVVFEIEDARQIPVVCYFKDDLVTLQSRLKQELLEGLSCELTEVYRIGDLTDLLLSKISGAGKRRVKRFVSDQCSQVFLYRRRTIFANA